MSARHRAADDPDRHVHDGNRDRTGRHDRVSTRRDQEPAEQLLRRLEQERNQR